VDFPEVNLVKPNLTQIELLALRSSTAINVADGMPVSHSLNDNVESSISFQPYSTTLRVVPSRSWRVEPIEPFLKL
jgi:hypothetical protein